jgi:endonuclease YncB( thermonuclease family)
MTALLPFAALIVAFAAMLFSTRQMRLRWRLLAMTLAFGLVVVAAAWNGSSVDHMGLISTLVRHPEIVVAAVQGNWPSVEQVIAPAVDILILFAGLLGIGCVIALSPGETIERIVRPMNIGLMGAIVGGVIVLVVSAVGFGAVSKRQVYVATIPAHDAIDGDTVRVGDVSLRIWGIDAPEDHQLCLKHDGTPFDCGSIARDALMKLALPGPIFCRAPTGQAALQESFGRPLVTCSSDQQGYGAMPDIGREMVAMGYAYPYQTRDGEVVSAYQPELATALANRDGFHAGLFQSPSEWRNDPRSRCELAAAAGPVHDAASPEGKRLDAQLKRLREACAALRQ